MDQHVIAHSGCSYSNVPLEFFVDGERHVVSRIVAAWLEESEGMEGMTRRVWRVVDGDEDPYKLTYYTVSGFWEVEKQGGGHLDSHQP